MFVQERRWKFPLGMHEDLSGLLSREGIQVWCSGAGAHSNTGVYSRGKPQLLPRMNWEPLCQGKPQLLHLHVTTGVCYLVYYLMTACQVRKGYIVQFRRRTLQYS